MLNYRIIARAFSGLIGLEALLFLICWLVGIGYGESHHSTWIVPIGICTALSLLLGILAGKGPTHFERRDGFFIVAIVWIIYGILGMLPFLFGGHMLRPSAAFFEAMSGFTTTGSTAFTNIDVLPHSILLWRSITHWVGGMGIIFFTLALLPALGIGEQELFSAEATGLKLGKLHSRVSTTAHYLWSTYLLITIACAIAYRLCGMNTFDAINHSFATIATGGFSTHTASIAYFNSPAIEYVSVFFMFLGSVNFSLLYFMIFKRRFRLLWKDEELRLFITFIILFTTTCTLSQWWHSGDPSEHGFRESLFYVTSMMSTTGFTTENFMQWPHLTWISLILVSVMGACAGSTAGGVKTVRILTAIKVMRTEVRRILHPRAVLPLRINNDYLTTDVLQSIFAYICCYLFLMIVGISIFVMLGYPVFDSFGLSISTFCNVGPGIGYSLGPLDSWSELPDLGLWLSSFLMLAGRLEIFGLLLPFTPSFWRDN
jgi:trk system potassium uptake protein trkH